MIRFLSFTNRIVKTQSFKIIDTIRLKITACFKDWNVNRIKKQINVRQNWRAQNLKML